VTINAALDSEIFRTYVLVVAALLLASGGLLGLLTLLGRDVSGIWRTWRGWLVMVPFVFIVLLLGRVSTIVGVVLLAMFGFREYARATGLADDRGMTRAVFVAIAILGGIVLATDPRLGTPGWYGLFMAMPVYVIAALLLIPILRDQARGQLERVALAILGFVYFGWMFSHLGFLANTPHAYAYLLYLVFAVELNDVAAFTSGKLFGGRKLRAAISPNKTVAGALGALTVSMLLPWLLWFSLPHFGPLQLVLSGLIVGIGGQLGDLVLSYIKRDLGVKDMGTTIAGHGGILDRVDSMIFVAPLFFHMVRWFYDISPA